MKSQRGFLPALSFAAAALGLAPAAPAGESAEIVTEADIVYKTVAGEKIALDLYRVAGRRYAQAPLAVWIHGGGFVKGDKAGVMTQHADVFGPLLRQHGYLVASLNYRLCTPEGPKVIDCATDCKDALRFLVQRAAGYGIDPARIVTVGASAGGGLALLTALTAPTDLPGDPALAQHPAVVRAAVSYFGVTDFAHSRGEFARGDEKALALFTPADRTDPRALAAVSPVAHMVRRAERIPVLLVHGDKDPVVPFSQSAWMDSEARRIGFPVQLVPVRNMRHGFQAANQGSITPALAEIWRTTVDFIVKANPAVRAGARQ